MISDRDRSGFFGGSDVDKIVGNWNTKTFEKWWLEKIGVRRNTFTNTYLQAGNCYEHRILESLGIPMELDKQIIIEDLKLRVNLDGNTEDTILEVKTYKHENGFKMPKKYIQQVQVQMFASGLRKAKIVVYGLVAEDYDNFFRPIDPSRRDEVVIAYDERWINEVFLPKLRYLAKCLEEGRFPQCA